MAYPIIGRTTVHKVIRTLQTLLVIAVFVGLVLHALPVKASPLTNRYISVSTSFPGHSAIHSFAFDIASSATLGSIEFEYCSNDPFVGAPCTAPVGLDLLSASLSSESGIVGFNIHANSTSNKIILTRTPAFDAAQAVSYVFDTVINPTTPSVSTYVRISTFASDDATGARTDDGTVVFSTSGGLGVGGFVPPFLIFCVGVSVTGNCTSATGNSINVGELSTTQARTATSQFAGATNDVSGYAVSLFGTTMTSGNNIISPLSVPTPSAPGTSQYGINLRSNTAPAVGQNPLGSGTLNPAADYNTPNQFTFKNGTLASSVLSTDFNTMTISYMINVPAGQAPGVYSTTATFIAIASF